MNPLALEQFGFKEGQLSSMYTCDRFWTCTVKDSVGRRFPITVRWWNFRKYGADHEGWDAEAQMKHRICGRENWLNIVLHSVEGMSPEDIVDYFTSVWQDLSADYVHKWEE